MVGYHDLPDRYHRHRLALQGPGGVQYVRRPVPPLPAARSARVVPFEEYARGTGVDIIF